MLGKCASCFLIYRAVWAELTESFAGIMLRLSASRFPRRTKRLGCCSMMRRL